MPKKNAKCGLGTKLKNVNGKGETKLIPQLFSAVKINNNRTEKLIK